MTTNEIDLPDNFQRVDDYFWAGGRPNRRQAKRLAADGLKSCLNLELTDEDTANFKGLGVTLIHLPDWEPLPVIARPLEDRHVKAFLVAARAAEKPLLAHCREGLNRTRLAVAVYRLFIRGDDLATVLAEFTARGGFWTEVDEAYISDIAARPGDFR